MSDRLPQPLMTVAFEPSAALPDCLRAALRLAKRLSLGVAFTYRAPHEKSHSYVVQPWMGLEDVLTLWDAEQAQSVAHHLGEHAHGGA